MRLVVGEIRGSQAVMITDDLQIVQLPTLLLPQGTVEGSIIELIIERNQREDQK